MRSAGQRNRRMEDATGRTRCKLFSALPVRLLLGGGAAPPFTYRDIVVKRPLQTAGHHGVRPYAIIARNLHHDLRRKATWQQRRSVMIELAELAFTHDCSFLRGRQTHSLRSARHRKAPSLRRAEPSQRGNALCLPASAPRPRLRPKARRIFRTTRTAIGPSLCLLGARQHCVRFRPNPQASFFAPFVLGVGTLAMVAIASSTARSLSSMVLSLCGLGHVHPDGP